MNDQTIILFLRLLHITFGVFWAGSVFNLALFVAPAIKASGPEGGKFMLQLGKTSYPVVVMMSAIITIVSGILLIGKLSNGFEPAWFRTSYARVLTAGSGLAFIGFIIGFTVNRPTAMRMNKIGDAVARTAAPASPEQMNELMRLRKRIFTATNYIAILLALAVISMSICRYVG